MAHWEMKPSIGRIVHYVPEMSPGDPHVICQAAMVVEIQDCDTVGLQVMAPLGIYSKAMVEHDETLQESDGFKDHKENTWHWPEMVNTGFSMKVNTDGNSPAGTE